MSSWTPQSPKPEWVAFEKEMALGVLERVDRYRKRLGITVEEMCKRLDTEGWPVSLSTMNGMLAGKRASISLAEVFVLARALEVAPIYLIAPVDSNSPFKAWPHASPRMTAYDAALWTLGKRVYKPSYGATKANWTPAYRMLEHADAHSNRARRLNAEIIAKLESGKAREEVDMAELLHTLVDLQAYLSMLNEIGAAGPRIPAALTAFLRDEMPLIRGGQLSERDALPIPDLTTGEELDAAVGLLERESGERSRFTPVPLSSLVEEIDDGGHP